MFSKIPAPASEFALRRSLDNRSCVRLQALRLALLVLLTFVFCRTPYYLLGLWYWFSPTMLNVHEVSPSLSHILFLFGLLNAPLDPLFYRAFTLGCQRRHQELSIDSSKEKKILRECPDRKCKPLDSWEYKQMWQQKGQEKQKRHSYNIHLLRVYRNKVTKLL